MAISVELAAFEDTHAWRSLNVVGEGFRNSDGSSRQAEIRRCVEGETVFLVTEPENPYDSNAVSVFSCRFVQIGHISRDHNQWIGGKLESGVEVKACIRAITGRDYANCGVLLAISI